METAVQARNTLKAEIESVKKYLQNEAFRYGDKLSWECTVDPEVNTHIPVPSLLIQTFVENAIKHGIFQDPRGGMVDVTILKSSVGVLIMITDNGIVFDSYPGNRKISNGKLRLLDEYLEIYNRQQPCTVSYKVLDRAAIEPGRTGSRVLITIKL